MVDFKSDFKREVSHTSHASYTSHITKAAIEQSTPRRLPIITATSLLNQTFSIFRGRACGAIQPGNRSPKKMSESMPTDHGAACFTNSIISSCKASSSAFWRSVSATVSSLYPSPQPNVPPSVTSRCRYCRETSERHRPSFLSM